MQMYSPINEDERSPEKTLSSVTVFDVTAVVGVATSTVGFGVHVSYIGVSGPYVIFPHLLGVWLSVFSLFFAFQLWYLQRKQFNSVMQWNMTFAYSVVEVLVSCVLLLGYSIGQRLDGSLWSLLILILLISCLVVLYSRKSRKRTVAQRNCIHISAQYQFRNRCAVSALDTFFKVLVFILLVLLLGGCWTQAIGYSSYPPRGSLYKITFSDGRSQYIHGWCTGPQNSTYPTFWIEVGGGGHCMTDLWGLQFSLNKKGYRVCQYDVPGTCHSAYALVNLNEAEVTPLMMQALGEPGPFVLLATMDNGPERAYAYALNYPTKVKAVILWQYTTANEWTPYQLVNNWTDQQTTDYAVSQILSRKSLGQIIEAIAVQWGLMTLFVPPGIGYVPQNMMHESQFLNLFNEKQWATQVNMLSKQVRDPTTIFTPSKFISSPTIYKGIPILVLQSLTDVSLQCKNQNVPLDSTQCKIINKTWELTQQSTVYMASLTPNSTNVYINATGFLSEAPTLDSLVNYVLNFSHSVK